eukprot:91974_1
MADAAEETKESIMLQTTELMTDNNTINYLSASKPSNNDMTQKLLPQRKVTKLRFADVSQLQQITIITNTKFEEMIPKLEKQAITQTSHGKCSTSNFVMDFQMDIGTVYKPNCRMINGVLSGKLTVQQRKSIKNIIIKIWQTSKHTKNILCCHNYKYVLYALCLFVFIGIPIILLYTVTDLDSILLILICVGLICVGMFIWCVCLHILKWNGYEFRAEFLSQMTKYMDTKLKQQYPNLLFTLIYPVKMEESFNYFTSIRSGLLCYLRVSVGIIDVDDFEPLVHRTCDQNNEELPEYNENCKLVATAKGFGDVLNNNNVGKVASHAGNAIKVVKSMSNIISNI